MGPKCTTHTTATAPVGAAPAATAPASTTSTTRTTTKNNNNNNKVSLRGHGQTQIAKSLNAVFIRFSCREKTTVFSKLVGMIPIPRDPITF